MFQDDSELESPTRPTSLYNTKTWFQQFDSVKWT